MSKEDRRQYIFAQLGSLPNATQYVEVIKYIEDLEQQVKKQKEVIDKIEEKIKENIVNAKYEITALTITDRVYYKYIEDMLNDLLEILEDKGVSE